MKLSNLTITTTLLMSTLGIALGTLSSAKAQDFTDMLGQEQIDRGTMDRNRRSRGQTETLWGESDDNSSSPTPANRTPTRQTPTFLTRVTGDSPILLVIGVDVEADGEVIPIEGEKQDVVYLEAGVQIVPTGRSVSNAFVPVRVTSTGQRGWMLMNQIILAD